MAIPVDKAEPRGLGALHLAAKRRRLSAHDWDLPTDHHAPLKIPPATAPLSTGLDSLPVEILAIILDFSLEASLIHTSKRLWCCLPSYVHYTKPLALKALTPLEEWPEWPASTSEHPSADIAHLQQSLDPDTQSTLRDKVFSSGWFKERHLLHTHRTLLFWTILQCCSGYGDNAPSKYQRQRIKSFVEHQSAPSSSAVLYLRVPSGGRRIRYLSAKQLSVTISGAPFFRPLSFRVLDFGNTVPDDLLRIPFTGSKAVVIRNMCKSIWGSRVENRLHCNRELLQQALLECITFCDTEKFHILLSLEERSRSPDALTVLDLRLIRRAVVDGRSSMLIRLVKQMWTSPKSVAVSDADLVAVMDEAKAYQYPEFHNTSRILAMEVAAKWKMAEVETTGRKAHRVPTDWPPRLIYLVPGSSDSQIWFIPRDSNYDVDWEASRDLPWLPMDYT